MMLDLIVSFLCGAVVTVVLLVVGFYAWFSSQPQVNASPHTNGFKPFVRPQLPQHLEEVFADVNDPDISAVRLETCRWVNLMGDFLFRELRDSTLVKRILMKKINAEFEELLLTKTEGRILEQLTVRDYFLGTSMPIIKDVNIVQIECSPDDSKEPVLIDVAMNIDYSGGGEVKIDADLVFNKSAYVAVTVVSLRGRMRVRFSRLPSTHWSFSFYQEPELDLRVDSHFEGRSFPKLSSLIESQMRRYIRKKYTLPACKIRHKPFFKKPKPQDQLLEVYVKNAKLTVGELLVDVVDCSRLVDVEAAERTYCTLALDCSPYQPQVNLWRTQWPTHEMEVPKDQQHRIGIHFKQVQHMIVVDYVILDSAAMTTGILKGDVLIRINNVKVTSVKQVERLIQRSKGNSVLVTLQRPPPHFNPLCSTPSHPHPAHPRSSTFTSDGGHEQADREDVGAVDHYFEAHSDEEGDILHVSTRAAFDGDSVSLCGVGGERSIPDEGLRRRVNTTLEGRSLTPELLDAPIEEASSVRPTHLAVNLESASPQRPAERRRQFEGAHSSVPGSAQQTTTEKAACKNPKWGESFVFNILDEHNYLNVCVWSKLTDESGDLLIGHVTIPLMDIALECLCTSSSYHNQRYVLVAAQTIKPSASRATLQAKSSVGGDPASKDKVLLKGNIPFAGDIFLRFKHHPQLDTGTADSEGAVMKSQADDQPKEQENEASEARHMRQLPSDHHFCLVEVVGTEGSQQCDICFKKIWSLKSRLMKCQKCGLKCHKKCVDYCTREILCINDGQPNVKQREEGGFTMLDVEEENNTLLVGQEESNRMPHIGEEGSDKEIEGDYGHRRLQQQPPVTRTKTSLSNSYEFVDGSQPTEKYSDGPTLSPLVLNTTTKVAQSEYDPEGTGSGDSEAQSCTPIEDSSSVDSVEVSYSQKKYFSSRYKRSDIKEINEIEALQDQIDQYTDLFNKKSMILKEGRLLSSTEEQDLQAELSNYQEKINVLSSQMKTCIEEEFFDIEQAGLN